MMEAEMQIMSKVSGYLEKKGRKKMMSCYKKYWFVLEGRLLLYYKSKDEYDAISPCKGSVTLGPTCNVKPCTANIGVFQIESKTTTITLRAETRDEQHKWMQAIMSALNQNNNAKKLSHFRYSLAELTPLNRPPLERQNTFPERFTNSSPKLNNMKIIEKLQKIGAHTYGIGPKLQRSKTTLERQKQMSVSDESLSSTGNLKKDRVLRKTESVIIENEEYGKLDYKRCANSVETINVSSEELYERIPSSDSVFIKKEADSALTKDNLVDSPAYCSIKQSNPSNTAEEGIYTNPGEVFQLDEHATVKNNTFLHNMQNGKSKDYICESIDVNDNNIHGQIRKQSLSPKETENIYSEADYEANRTTGNSAEYADIAQYTEVALRNSSLSSEGSNEEKEKKLFKGFGKKNKNQKEKPDEKKGKLRKSESFLQRVWIKKTKSNKNKRGMSLSNENILDKLNMPEEDTIKMLSALQDILESKKTAVKKLHDSEEGSRDVKDQELSMIYHEVLVDDSNAEENQSNEDPPCPLLPPRNQKQQCLSPYHDVPKAQPTLPPKKKNVQSVQLEDILNDINKQTQTLHNLHQHNLEQCEETKNGKGKVKALIKRFSIGKEDGVEMRKKNNWKMNPEYCTDSGELDSLLEELAKVTTAPIMTPGVTTSLINPDIADKELLKLIPIRRRRISDPDYDIPRPHRSLTNIPKRDDNALEATRFFGPILKPSDFEAFATNRPPTPAEDYYSNLPSITPDSLEVEYDKLSHDENRNISYHSHDYLHFNERKFLIENNLYSDPRLLHKSRHEYPGIYSQDANFNRIEDSDNVFIDSLET